MMTLDEALRFADQQYTKQSFAGVIAAEVLRLRSELEAHKSALQNLMSFLSVNGSWADVQPREAEQRIRDGIDMLVRTALERAERAEREMKEAREQEPLTWGNSGELMDILKNPIYARPVPAASTKFTDDDLAEIHQLAYELGGTESGEYLLDGDQLDSMIVKAASLFYKPVPAAVAVPAEWREMMVKLIGIVESSTKFHGCDDITEKARALLQSTEPKK